MCRAKVIKKCKDIWNDNSLSSDEKHEKLIDYIQEEEKHFGKKSVEKLLNQLSKKGIEVDSARLWNECREK